MNLRDLLNSTGTASFLYSGNGTITYLLKHKGQSYTTLLVEHDTHWLADVNTPSPDLPGSGTIADYVSDRAGDDSGLSPAEFLMNAVRLKLPTYATNSVVKAVSAT